MAAIDPRDDPASVVAAERVMLELWTVLAGFADAMTIVGGSAPPLLTGDRPDDPYVGTLDVDLVVDPIGVPGEVYRTIAQILRERAYVQLDQPFRWLRSLTVDGRRVRRVRRHQSLHRACLRWTRAQAGEWRQEPQP